MKKDPVYVTGHQHPDSDSIASAIAYAFFKRSQGINAIACRLGKVNAETRYLLDRFHFPEPPLLSDARVCVGDIAMDSPEVLPEDATIFECLQTMEQTGRTYCGIVREDGSLVGMVTKSDISVIGLYDTAKSIAIISRTPLENFRKTLGGRVIYNAPEMRLNGNVSVIAMTQPENLDSYAVEGRIVICGNHPETQKKMIEKGAGMLIVVWAQSISADVIRCAKEHSCSILISGHGGMNTIRYLYFSPSVSQIMKRDLITFDSREIAEDVGKKMLQSRHRVYPVLDAESRPVGYVSRFHIMRAASKKIILVDHNEFSQSVRAIEKAEVLEVIDHHRINDFSSMSPVQFRNEIVGSTATIIATIFRENQVPISENLAGLMLGAILSDTLNLHSPTTTPKDIATANILAAIADVDVDDFAREMFEAAGQSASLSIPEQIKGDLKFFDVDHCRVSISQVTVPSLRSIAHSPEAIEAELHAFAEKTNVDISMLVFTSILENGSTFFFGGQHADWGRAAFPGGEGKIPAFHEGILSRKQQILPQLNQYIIRYT